MKVLIASDIHGSFKYARMLVDRINEEKPDRVVLLGDVLYHGPRNDLPEEYSPKKVIELLSDPDIIAVKGNCDAEVDDMVLAFELNEDLILMREDSGFLYFCHGHRHLPPATEGDYVFSGHTHVPKFEVERGVTFVNPGSVSIPKENSHHGYVIYEKGEVGFYDVETGEKVSV